MTDRSPRPSAFAVLALPALLSAGAAPLSAQDLATADTAEIMRLRPGSVALSDAGRRYNPEAPVTAMCYTRIEGRFNPCYVCHQDNNDGSRPNFMQDGSLQKSYAFSDAGMTNHWTNLFVDRSAEVAAISDEAILDWIDGDNYSDLEDRLSAAGFPGWIPDLDGYADAAHAFDADGLARDGSWWVAFTYKPQPSTFWPTNGSTDDVQIRLPARFYTTADGATSRDVYFANLALLEMAFQDIDDVSLPEVDEAAIGVDIDGDGSIGRTRHILRRASYLGAASPEAVQRMSYPEGTEFLHSVRYVGIDGEEIVPARRMKELRYMIKTRQLTIPEIASRYGNERQEKIDENLPRYIDLGPKGMDTGFGWTMLAWIEDEEGRLRRQTNEELFFCRGCHATVGANIDQTWAFPRKMPGADGWRYIDLNAMTDVSNLGEEKGEIETYLARVGGGDEFRANAEMIARWFNPDGTVAADRLAGKTVYELLTPSVERALMLNKAYRVIVAEQSFLFGRDATVTPLTTVHAAIDEATAPTLPEEYRYSHDIRLDWD
ncbi:hypothetical protein [Tropicimonas sp. IMCC6043]|uniref:hypothetical protein n=1 Tax=Tropicimonas sp. IMCC6043 TaxID=2510645 RepID=UPI00101BA2E1|nr:hypothetical protein [Tropicimonas sp. IMCC6043]RYH10080.1 hypothetical protein EU800_09330 [Tropicimonas sp. IMCC6043]